MSHEIREADRRHPVVLRMEGLFPADLAGYERHRRRKGGDLGHVDETRSNLNRRLIGNEDWAQRALKEIEDMRVENFAKELEGLKKRRRKAELVKRVVEGPKEPWRGTRHGPLREVIITAHQDWFTAFDQGNMDDLFGESREDRFEQIAVAWLKDSFGEDVIHARADLDETTYHIHAIVMPRSRTKDGRKMLQPSKHPLIKDYEKAQDSVGEWFSELGLKRGERRKQALREAVQKHREAKEAQDKDVEMPVELPQHVEHVSPREWREKKERQLADREASVGKREKEAATNIKIANAVAAGDPQVLAQVAQPDGKSAAARLFGKAFTTLRAKSRKAAQKEARGEVQAQFDEIKAADDAIVEAAAALPEAARKKIVKARQSLVGRITALKRAVHKWKKSDPKDGPEV
ncbi:MAG: plasmid recombination protein [Shimia sp.]|uniref:plasmid recombination protein n=1 Tax=Shimia sp. TaxID=1954381 RepID=UPI001B1C443E|nr:plasmid recombination protein [Shimia sp.]MBO6897260.1 plasmid recombination protein [Shimia sp.]